MPKHFHSSKAQTFFRSWAADLQQPVDIASLTVFRIAFGILMFEVVFKSFRAGLIDKYFLMPNFTFTYHGFDWVQPFPGYGMYIFFIIMGLATVLITLGLFYRLAAITFFITFSYFFLMEQTRYLNHFYLVVLIGFIMIFVPANRCLALDNRMPWGRPSDTTPKWSVWILQFQMAVVYCYGGIAKLNFDWLRGEPMRLWFGNMVYSEGYHPFFKTEWFIYFISYGGLIFDLLIVPFLIWKKTRLAAFICVVLFHISNHFMWNIGIFPFMGIAATTIFFSYDWPRRFIRLPKYSLSRKFTTAASLRPVASAVFALYCIVQLLVPFRHWLYPGPVVWTEEGHKFSWRMKLRSRRAEMTFFVHDKDADKIYQVQTHDILMPHQLRKAEADPHLILLMAHKLKEQHQQITGNSNVEVRATCYLAVNGRTPQLYFDPNMDLTQIRRTFWHDNWFYPMKTKL
ncbi:MAG: HTTM domain-containing protein [Verrucomicrobiota bacterium]